MFKDNILLVGANGIIGSYLHKSLSKKYCIQSIVSNRCEDKIYNFYVDLKDKKQLKKIIQQVKPFSQLIFLVGLAHSKGNTNSYSEFYDNNYLTLKNLLNLLKFYKKEPDKILYASSISVYGEKLNNSLYFEDCLLSPKTPYAETKLLAERFLLKNFKDKSWILRFSPVYSDSFKLNIKKRTVLFKTPFIVGDGLYKLSLCNIKNIEELVVNICDDNVFPGIYNVSDPVSYTYVELQKMNKSNLVIRIPKAIIKMFYCIGKLISNRFLIENSIKLISDNIYPSDKIQSQISLSYIYKGK